MIETKEQYEKIRTQAVWEAPPNEDDLYFHQRQVRPLLETIEALREVARASDVAMEIEQAHWSEYGTIEDYESHRLDASKDYWTKRNALPDWIIDEP